MASIDAAYNSIAATRPNGALAASSETDLTRALRRVQELEAEVQRLRDGSNGSASNGMAEMRLFDVEGLLVRQAMERHQGNVSRAARTLGLSRSALYRRLERHKIQ